MKHLFLVALATATPIAAGAVVPEFGPPAIAHAEFAASTAAAKAPNRPKCPIHCGPGYCDCVIRPW